MPNEAGPARNRKIAAPQLPTDRYLLTIFESLSDNVFVVDRNWNFTYLNRNAFETVGCPEYLIGRNLWEAFPAVEESVFGAAYKRAMAGGMAVETEGQSRTNGEWYSANIYPLPDGLAIFSRKITARKKKELALANSEYNFRSIFETLPLGIVFHDSAGNVIDSNPAAERILGVSLEDMRNNKAANSGIDVFDETGAPIPADRLTAPEALRTGQTVRNRVAGFFNKKTQDYRWVSVDGIPLFEAGGSVPINVFTLFNDITEQKRAEQALRESQAHLALAQRVAAVGSALLDFRTNDLKWSDETYRIYGVDKATFLPSVDAVLKMIHPDDRQAFTNGIEMARRGQKVEPIEFRVFTPGGQLRIIRRVADMIHDASGAVTGFIATNHDVTEQKQAEQALMHSQAHLALAQRVAHVGSTMIDFRTGEWEWSEETYRIFGVSKKEFRPALDTMMGLINSNDRQVFREAMKAARNGVIPYPLQFRAIGRDGKERIFYQETDLIRNESGTVTGAIATSSDITDLREAEKQRELLQNQLYHAQRLDSLGTLAGGIAHDLNNTLVPILGLSEALLKKLDADSPQRPLLEVVYQAGIRARDLVRQILAFSRRENPDNRLLDLSSFLRETMRLVRASVPTTITIDEKIEDVPQILGDSGQLHQVILNLVTNAAQAIGENTGTITIASKKCEKNLLDEQGRNLDSFVRISVEDTGAGMDEETQKRIFEPFFTTKQIGVGTGLGLSVVHGIVAAHGGHIQVSSKLNHGTRFDVFLPTSEPEQVQP